MLLKLFFSRLALDIQKQILPKPAEQLQIKNSLQPSKPFNTNTVLPKSLPLREDKLWLLGFIFCQGPESTKNPPLSSLAKSGTSTHVLSPLAQELHLSSNS